MRHGMKGMFFEAAVHLALAGPAVAAATRQQLLVLDALVVGLELRGLVVVVGAARGVDGSAAVLGAA